MKKTLLLSICSVLLLSFAHHSQATGYDTYVNIASTSTIEDGSQTNSFKTITSALAATAVKPADQRKVFIANGNYAEKVTVEETMSLTGENNTQTVINGDGFDHVVEINKTSTLSNLKVTNGVVGIFIAPGAGATIASCKIEKSGKIGIEVAKSSTNDSEKVTVSGSEIYNGNGKGFYIQKRRILIQNNSIHDNDEEGIDIRAGVKGTIKKNTITKNGESGIELIVGSTSLKITSNKISSNSANGITHQFYKDFSKKGNITLEKNKIQKNDAYGLQCTAPSGGNSPKSYWTKSIDLSKNIFSGNDKPFSSRCNFPLPIKKLS